MSQTVYVKLIRYLSPGEGWKCLQYNCSWHMCPFSALKSECISRLSFVNKTMRFAMFLFTYGICLHDWSPLLSVKKTGHKSEAKQTWEVSLEGKCISYLCVWRWPQIFEKTKTVLTVTTSCIYHSVFMNGREKGGQVKGRQKGKKERTDIVEAVIWTMFHTVCAEEASSLVAVRCWDDLKRIKLHVCAAVLWNISCT